MKRAAMKLQEISIQSFVTAVKDQKVNGGQLAPVTSPASIFQCTGGGSPCI